MIMFNVFMYTIIAVSVFWAEITQYQFHVARNIIFVFMIYVVVLSLFKFKGNQKKLLGSLDAQF
jgi:hypothetical protein